MRCTAAPPKVALGTSEGGELHDASIVPGSPQLSPRGALVCQFFTVREFTVRAGEQPNLCAAALDRLRSCRNTIFLPADRGLIRDLGVGETVL